MFNNVRVYLKLRPDIDRLKELFAMKISVNVIGQALLVLLHMGNILSGVVPANKQYMVAALLGLLQLSISTLAHYRNPDGTSATLPYKFEPMTTDQLAAYQKLFGGAAKLLALAALLGGLSVTARAQSPATPALSTNGFAPAYYVGGGVTYDYYGKTGFAASTEIGVRIAGTKFYSYTTIELARDTSTLRTGGAYLFYQSGNWSLVGLGDAGLANGAGLPVLGSLSSGGFAAYDIGNRVTKGASHFYVGFGGRYVQTASLGSQPVAIITFGKGF